jgi:hypothetical protein
MQPIKPNNKPSTCPLLSLVLKNSNPIKRVNIGVNEFNIPVSELLKPV